MKKYYKISNKLEYQSPLLFVEELVKQDILTESGENRVTQLQDFSNKNDAMSIFFTS